MGVTCILLVGLIYLGWWIPTMGLANIHPDLPRLAGMVFGILLLMLINNALIVLNVNPYYQQVALGLVLGVAIVADRIRARSRPNGRFTSSATTRRSATSILKYRSSSPAA